MDRRKFIQGTAALFCAPAIVKASSIMPVAPPPGMRLMGGIMVYESDFGVGIISTSRVMAAQYQMTESSAALIMREAYKDCERAIINA